MKHADKTHRSKKPQSSDTVPVNHYRLLFSSIPDPCLVLDPKLKIVAVNDAYLSAMLTTHEEIIGRDIFELFKDDPAQTSATSAPSFSLSLRASLNKVLADRVADTIAVRKYGIRKSDDRGVDVEERYWSSVNTPVIEADKEIVYIIHRIIDVTDFLLNEELATQRESLRESEQCKDRYLHNRCFPNKGGGISVYFQDITSRKRTEEALLREHYVLQSVMNGAKNSHLVYLDRDFNFVRVNEAYAVTCGYQPEEMIGKNHFSLYPHAENEAIFARVRDTGEPFEVHDKPFEFPDQPERGVTYWDWTLTPVKDETGEVTGLVFSLFETTSRKKAEIELTRQTVQLEETVAKLEDEKRLLSAVMEVLPIGVSITDISGGVILANNEFNKIWGEPRPETRSIKDYSLYKAWWGDTDKRVADEEWASAIAVKEGKTTSQMIRIQRFDGTEGFIINSASPVHNSEGNIVGSAVAIQDITELKLAQKALDESEHLLRLFIEHAPVALAMFDRDMKYINASARWSKDYNLTDRNLAGKLHYEVFPDLPLRWKEAHRRGLAGEVLREEADLFERADGSVSWVRWEIRPWYRHSGKIGGIVIFAENITERKQQEVQLQNLNEELEQRVKERTRELIETQHQFLHTEKLAAIGKLSASIAHEINNPLQSIITVLKGISTHQIFDETSLNLIKLAIGEGDRIKWLIRSLQDFYRPSSGRTSLIDINSVLDLLVLLHKSDLKNKRIKIELDYSHNLPMISAVSDQIKQVFLNLITNAADACSARGGVITISTRQQNDKVVVAIKDTGVGIKPEQMDHIFRPFYTTKQEVKGTGLGLSVSYGIVKKHGGEIRVTSEPGEGATFMVLLPITELISRH